MVTGAMIGAGVWGEVQLEGWRGVPGARIAALCDLDERRLAERGARFDVDRLYTSAAELLRTETLDFVDVCVRPEAQLGIIRQAAERGVHVLCQKPFCTSLREAEEAVACCEERGVRLMVNENFRWQAWYRQTKALLEDGAVGTPFLARVNFRLRTSLPTFAHRQSYFREMPRWAVFELGVHYLDLYRYLFGEPLSLYARLHRVSPHVRGEDVQVLVLSYPELTCLVQHSWASVPVPGLDRPEGGDVDPWRLAHGLEIDGSAATLALRPAGTLHLYGDARERSWSFGGDVRRESVASALSHFAECIGSGTPFETSGEDYLRTMALVYASYRSAETGSVVPLRA